jgi:predicted glutamine amidotransferase
MHNGLIHGFLRVKRDLVLEVDPALYPEIEGSTDSEVFFFLALTFGLEDNSPAAVARAVGLIEAVGERHGVEVPVQMSVATTDGERVWAFRSSSSRSRWASSRAPGTRCRRRAGESSRPEPTSSTASSRRDRSEPRDDAAYWRPPRTEVIRPVLKPSQCILPT